MKVIFDRAELLSVIMPASGLVPGHNTANATDGILFECPGDEEGMCTVCAYDMEKGLRASIPAQIIEEGKFIINTQKIIQIVRSLPEGEVEFDISADYKAKISSGASSFEIVALKGEDFPGLPLLSGDRVYNFTGKTLRSIITKTMISVAQNNVNAAFNGVFFKIENNVMNVVGCDGNRLTVCEEELPEGSADAKVIVPLKVLAELLKSVRDNEEEVTMMIARRHIIFKMYGLIYFTRLIDAEYLDFKRLIPTTCQTEVYVNADELRGALERASVITEDKLGGNSRTFVKFEIVDGLVKITSSSVGGSIYEEVPAAKNGPDLTIAFTCRYLLDALRTCPEAYTLRIRLNTDRTGVRIEEARGSGICEDGEAAVPSAFDRPESDGDEKMKFLYFVMPRSLAGR